MGEVGMSESVVCCSLLVVIGGMVGFFAFLFGPMAIEAFAFAAKDWEETIESWRR